MAQDGLYEQVFNTFGGALERLARSYEADPDKRRDLLQEIHFAVWRSLARFGEQCSLRTWTYRVAHNVAASHVLKHRRGKAGALVGLEEVETLSVASDADRRIALDHLYRLIHQLRPPDREVMLLYLEGLDAASIAEVTGFSAGNVATKIHRIKNILSREVAEGGRHGR